ncbi:pilus assembly protein [Sphingomonas sp. BGYR3]|uniref:TadE/TadG family type IV pilus assembly protein n=1 Tax=Sphingomonas sp. BGYR3 TaxID=2975483 RepID=UPI0021A565E4|nr:TadE family protein [Sphingomonas sp. BGYR3]MDG5487480.1 pilus assembly protein [Sphingomonas sp. BGYR3]
MAIVEFGLCLPLFIGFIFAGLEFANYTIANNRTQRVAAMTADLVAQSGTGAIGATEGQIYDLLSAIDLTAQPFDLRNHGRVILTAVRGTDNDNNGQIENRIIWQRFDGGYVAAVPRVGCNQTVQLATLPANRVMTLDEILFHVQVTYEYQPLFSHAPFHWLNLPTAFRREAVFRARSTQFQTPTPDARFPPKNKCNTANGL